MMKMPIGQCPHALVLCLCTVNLLSFCPSAPAAPDEVTLPKPVRAVWDVAKAHRELTPTRERICINGLWRWQPATGPIDAVPGGAWGFFKVPGCWPGITNYMQKDSQTLFAHPSWKDRRLSEITRAWYQRQIAIPAAWAGRRITLSVEYLNSYAVVYVDGRRAGEIRFPAGEVDLTAICRPGRKHLLSIAVVALPLKGVMLSYSNTASAVKVKGSVARRGLCGDVYLVAAPPGARLGDVKVDTSVRKGLITCTAVLEGLDAGRRYVLRGRITEGGRDVRQIVGKPFQGSDVKGGRTALTESWRPEKLWDIHTPGNIYTLRLSLLDAGGKVLDEALGVRFGFREFWIDGRDFYLNGSRIYLSAVPLDNAQVGWTTPRSALRRRATKAHGRACCASRASGSTSSTRTTTAASRALT